MEHHDSDDLDPIEDERQAPLPGRAFGWLLTVGGLIGFVAAFTLMVEKIQILIDPDYVPSCSINPILSCGSIMVTEQAEVFGFPNPLLGIAGFPVVVATGALVLARVPLPRFWWLGLQVGTTLALGFMGWLAFQSLYRIGALCPYCMVVWAMVVAVFWALTSSNIDRGVLGRGGPVARAVSDYAVLLATLTYLVVVVAIGLRFSDYWLSLI
ncbi:vitamin K epoxide reductase family protein [Nocardioidaceae bacterium]|nr:vitamin K epoxide reductase family protein [Nocardioidaceae bacterium]